MLEPTELVALTFSTALAIAPRSFVADARSLLLSLPLPPSHFLDPSMSTFHFDYVLIHRRTASCPEAQRTRDNASFLPDICP